MDAPESRRKFLSSLETVFSFGCVGAVVLAGIFGKHERWVAAGVVAGLAVLLLMAAFKVNRRIHRSHSSKSSLPNRPERWTDHDEKLFGFTLEPGERPLLTTFVDVSPYLLRYLPELNSLSRERFLCLTDRRLLLAREGWGDTEVTLAEPLRSLTIERVTRRLFVRSMRLRHPNGKRLTINFSSLDRAAADEIIAYLERVKGSPVVR